MSSDDADIMKRNNNNNEVDEESLESMIHLANQIIQRNPSSQSILTAKSVGKGDGRVQPSFSRIAGWTWFRSGMQIISVGML